MAKSYQHRPSAEVKKKKEEEKRRAQRQLFYKEHKGALIACAVAAVVVILLGALAIDYFYAPEGSMKIFMGQLVGADENAIIIDGNSRIPEKSPRYYTLGHFNGMEGYTEDFERMPVKDPKTRSFYLVADDPENIYHSIYVAGIPSPVEKAITKFVPQYFSSSVGPKEGSYKDLSFTYFYATGDGYDQETRNQSAALYLYIEAAHDFCVHVNLGTLLMKPDQLPGEEAMLEAVRPFLDQLDVITH